MKIHDVSLPLTSRLASWPGEPAFERRDVRTIGPESEVNSSALQMSAHSGTHVDAPLHFIPGGADAAALPLDVLIGPCTVGHVPDAREIGVAELEAMGVPDGCERLLLRTRNSRLWHEDRGFTEDFVALTPEGATWLVERRVRLIGTDYLSIQRFHDKESWTHRRLLGAGIVILEGLDLSRIPPGAYRLICLPLRIPGCEGAPARTVLVEE